MRANRGAMLNLLLAGLVVHLIALAAISGAAIRLCGRLGLDPREVLVWFGLAEMPKIIRKLAHKLKSK